MTEFDDEYREWDAAYVLGALSYEERKEYEVHLAQCPTCSNSLALLAGIPGFLGKIDSQTANAILDSAAVVSDGARWDDSIFIKKLAARAAKEQRTTRIRQSLIAAAALIICISMGAATGILVHARSGQPTLSSPAATAATAAAAAWHLTNLQPQIMSAELRITSKKWGTHFDWDCTYSKNAASWPAATRYNLVITDASGRKTTIASWSPSGGIAKGLSATTALPVSQIKMLEVTVTGSSTPIIVGVKV